jgi:transposase
VVKSELFCNIELILPCPRYSVLPALSLDGVLAVTIVQGSVNGDIFEGFIEELLGYMEPFPAPNSVLVMDNASIHKSINIQEMITET